jgi:hypothetical protein
VASIRFSAGGKPLPLALTTRSRALDGYELQAIGYRAILEELITTKPPWGFHYTPGA